MTHAERVRAEYVADFTDSGLEVTPEIDAAIRRTYSYQAAELADRIEECLAALTGPFAPLRRWQWRRRLHRILRGG